MLIYTEKYNGEEKAYFLRGNKKIFTSIESAKKRIEKAQKLRFAHADWISGTEKSFLDGFIFEGKYMSDSEIEKINEKVRLLRGCKIPGIYAADNDSFPNVDWIIGKVFKENGGKRTFQEKRVRPYDKWKEKNVLDVIPLEVEAFAKLGYDDAELNPQILADFRWLASQTMTDEDTLEYIVASRVETYAKLKEILWDYIPWETEYFKLVRDFSARDLIKDNFWYVGFSPDDREKIADQFKEKTENKLIERKEFGRLEKLALTRMALLFPDHDFHELLMEVQEDSKLKQRKESRYEKILRKLNGSNESKSHAENALYNCFRTIFKNRENVIILPPEISMRYRKIPKDFFRSQDVLNQFAKAACDYVDSLNDEDFWAFYDKWKIHEISSLEDYSFTQKEIIEHAKQRSGKRSDIYDFYLDGIKISEFFSK